MNSFLKVWKKAGDFLLKSVRASLLFLVGAYRTIGTTHLGGACRFEPSCSEYAVQSLKAHTPTQALRLIGSRLIRCRPGGPFGYDPVPPAKGPSK